MRWLVLQVRKYLPISKVVWTYCLVPKGGYIVGFVLAAWAWTYFSAKGRGKNLLKTLAAGLVGEALIFACGVLVLTAMFGFSFAVKVGLVPFLASESAKWILGSIGIYVFHKR